VLPLYPQYSATTTAAALDRVDAALASAPPERLAIGTITTTRGTSRRWRPASRRPARPSTTCCFPSTAFPLVMPPPEIPTMGSAAPPHSSSPLGSGSARGAGRSRSSRAWVARAGSSPTRRIACATGRGGRRPRRRRLRLRVTASRRSRKRDRGSATFRRRRR
jgi:hypothetical protein